MLRYIERPIDPSDAGSRGNAGKFLCTYKQGTLRRET
jgi:hypothetical protein